MFTISPIKRAFLQQFFYLSKKKDSADISLEFIA